MKRIKIFIRYTVENVLMKHYSFEFESIESDEDDTIVEGYGYFHVAVINRVPYLTLHNVSRKIVFPNAVP